MFSHSTSIASGATGSLPNSPPGRVHLAAVAERDFVITMLPTGDIVREVLLHQENASLRKTVRPGTLVIDMGSSDPRGTQALGAELASSASSLSTRRYRSA